MAPFWSRFSASSSSTQKIDQEKVSEENFKGPWSSAVIPVNEESPGGLSLEEDAAGGLGRHLGVFSCTMLIVGRIIGTGIFSTPSSILSSTGSVGASLLLWVAGFILSFCGLFIWLEFGTMFPRSGGEKVYLEAVYKKPKYLATVIFSTNAILLGFSASNCIVFASNILVSAGKTATTWSERGIALGVIFFVTLIHGITPRTGVVVMNLLTTVKIAVLLFVVVSGWVVLSGKTSVQDPHASFRDAFAGSSHSSNDYATAMFKVLYAYGGWSNVNYVLNNVRDPVRTLKISGVLGLGICSLLYIFANIAYFSAATKAQIQSSGITVAALFFKNVYGGTAERALSVLVALRHDFALGVPRESVFLNNGQTFAAARVNQELAKEGIPLPFGNKFWASNYAMSKAPVPGLIVHLIPSVIVIIAPPMAVAYPFILDIEGYPAQ
ncbi:hypothetical protein ID866_9676, partial [Astraeus odoratus]